MSCSCLTPERKEITIIRFGYITREITGCSRVMEMERVSICIFHTPFSRMGNQLDNFLFKSALHYTVIPLVEHVGIRVSTCNNEIFDLFFPPRNAHRSREEKG